MAFKDLMTRLAERRASRGQAEEGAAEGAAGPSGRKRPQAAAGQAGDLATSGLTYLASQNPWGNIKGLGKPVAARPYEEEEKEGAAEAAPNPGGAAEAAPNPGGAAAGVAEDGGAGERAAADIFSMAAEAE